jgi:hypothetical protein
MSPEAIKALRIGTIVVGVVTGAVVAGYILYRLGYIPSGESVVEELGDVAQAVL